jgi:hypothetical protein
MQNANDGADWSEDFSSRTTEIGSQFFMTPSCRWTTCGWNAAR